MIATAGIFAAKNSVPAHGVDERSKTVLKMQLKRDQVVALCGFDNTGICDYK